MIVSTTNDVAGMVIEQTLGLVRGNTVRGLHQGQDLLAFLRNMVGGEILEYTQLIAQAREQAMDRMLEQAQQLGANAVIGIHFASSEIASGAAEILVYGTAVKLSPEPE